LESNLSKACLSNKLIGKEKMKNIKNRTIASLIATRLKLKERT
jgi:hypothetical protein